MAEHWPEAVLTVRLPGQLIAKGVAAPTVVMAVALLSSLLGSATLEETVAWLLSVPLVALLTFTTSVNVAEEAELMSVDLVQVTVPVPPTEGVVADHPDTGVTDTNVTPAGSASVTLTELAALGPALVTVIV